MFVPAVMSSVGAAFVIVLGPVVVVGGSAASVVVSLLPTQLLLVYLSMSLWMSLFLLLVKLS